MRIGILENIDERGVTIISVPPPRTVGAVKLGEMWAEPAGAWKLLD